MPFAPRSWKNIQTALVSEVFERAFRACIDTAWVVSQKDANAMRWLAGIRDSVVLPYGIDSDYYRPSETPVARNTAVFWGRLDFGPNIQAVEWFCRRVWPSILKVPTYGAIHHHGVRPDPGRGEVHLATRSGHQGEHSGSTPEIAARAVAVMPFVSGAGIKNKLLEAAAMGKAIICTPRSLNALKGRPAVRVCSSVREWVDTLIRLWDDDAERLRLGSMPALGSRASIRGKRRGGLRSRVWPTTLLASQSGERAKRPPWGCWFLRAFYWERGEKSSQSRDGRQEGVIFRERPPHVSTSQ